MDYIKIVDDILEKSGKKYDSAAIVNKDGVIEYTKRINHVCKVITKKSRPKWTA